MKQPALMGILNVTPDSFFDGGKYLSEKSAVEHIDHLIKNNVDIIDVGAESTRPGSDRVSPEKEIKRLKHALEILKSKKAVFSIDTMNHQTAAFALKMGAKMINDVSGFSDPYMIDLAVEHQCEVCVMHMLDNPKSMQLNPCYPGGVMEAITVFCESKINTLIKKGIKKSNITIDPGIGFGKTVQDNLNILRNISELKKLDCKILIGLSRKSFMKKILGKNTDELLPATLVMNTIALLGGADIIRVHDIIEHMDLINLVSHYNAG